MIVRIRSLAALGLILSLAACGGGGGGGTASTTTPTPTPATPASFQSRFGTSFQTAFDANSTATANHPTTADVPAVSLTTEPLDN